jgi:hypothetical protein
MGSTGILFVYDNLNIKIVKPEVNLPNFMVMTGNINTKVAEATK